MVIAFARPKISPPAARIKYQVQLGQMCTFWLVRPYDCGQLLVVSDELRPV